jgi:hypothetical protein
MMAFKALKAKLVLLVFRVTKVLRVQQAYRVMMGQMDFRAIRVSLVLKV